MKTEKKTVRESITKPALERLYFIDRQIASGKYPNVNQLVEYLREPWGSVSIATVNRDIAFMKDRLNAPIEYNALERGYFYTKSTFRLPAGFTSAEDLLALGMAKNILSLYQNTPIYDSARYLLNSITAPLAAEGNTDWYENRIAVPPIAAAKVKTDIWKIVIGGLKENRIITFDYRGTWDEEYHKRKVRPYQLLFDSGVWYLYGFSEERKATRIFSLSHIKNAQLTKEVFSLPKNFRYADFSGESYFGVYIGQEKMRFAIDCYGEAVIYATDRQWAADQKITESEDGITIEFSSTQYDKVLKWVLSCGCNAVPRKPKKLVDNWKWHVSEMRKMVSR